MAQFTLIPSTEVSELAEDIRAIFDELETTLRAEQRATAGECHPALDVFETDEAVEIVMDVSGVAPEALRVVFRAGVVLIAGEKAPPVAHAPQTFHVVEREFGRFARGVRVNGAFDLQRGRAVMREGELTIVLPKRAERRGRPYRIPIEPQRPA
jgi:HSP20 family protein